MPRRVTFKVEAIDDLFRQLRYAPPETRRKQMDAAEHLVSEIDPSRNYPESFIVYRITGYRSERAGDDVMLVGEALRPDLVNFVLRLSETITVPSQSDERQAITLDEVAKKLNVTPKTVQRYRRRGLVVHSVIYPDGNRKLGCFTDALERFIAQHAETVERAGSFTRVSDELNERIIEAARARREETSASLNTIARELAPRFGRAHETVRHTLREHDRRAAEPIFADHGPLTERDARIIYRGWRLGVPAPKLADRFGRTATTIHRTVLRHRAEQLVSLEICGLHLPTFDMPDAESVLLSVPAVTELLDAILPLHEATVLLETLPSAPPIDSEAEAALVVAYNLLKRRASNALAHRPEWPGARLVDRIETDLRWATMLKRKLISLALPAAVGMTEQHLHRKLVTQPADEIAALLQLAIRTVGDVIERADPSKGHRVERLARYAVARELAREGTPARHHRAAVRHAPGSVHLPIVRDITPWQVLLDLPPRLISGVQHLAEPDQSVVTRRYGLDGRAPWTLAMIAQSLKLTDAAATRLFGRAHAALRQHARGRTSG